MKIVAVHMLRPMSSTPPSLGLPLPNVCEDAQDRNVVIVGGRDMDLAPNAAPFKIELGKQPGLDKTWKVTRREREVQTLLNHHRWKRQIGPAEKERTATELVSPLLGASTHSQIMLLQALKKANYQLPLLITDSGVPPLSNNTEFKVQVCVCQKNKMHCSSGHAHRASLLVLLATLLLALLCEYHQNHNTADDRAAFGKAQSEDLVVSFSRDAVGALSCRQKTVIQGAQSMKLN
ncbi:Cadherin-13 [Liparis tanakae]|uniref:Cadherin-13 n=1 Tax=Liparis tanakae TaxID=230148 RepID=A0A4Z2J510_9TELE|nr:Cadherin-13 [Liparis tanakae]